MGKLRVKHGRIVHPGWDAKDEAYNAFETALRPHVAQSPHYNDDPAIKVRHDAWVASTDKYNGDAGLLQQRRAERGPLEHTAGGFSDAMRNDLRAFAALLIAGFAGNPKAIETFGLRNKGARVPLVALMPVDLHVVPKKKQPGLYTVRWRASKGAGIYELWQSTDPAGAEGTFTLVYSGRAPSFSAAAPLGTKLWFRVRARGNETSPFTTPVLYVVF